MGYMVSLKKVSNGKGEAEAIAHFLWKRSDIADKILSEMKRLQREGVKIRKQTQKTKTVVHLKPVLCVETGVVYPSIKDAEEAIGRNGVCHCIAGRQKSCGGYHWKYADNKQ